jgi:hypothetical protein
VTGAPVDGATPDDWRDERRARAASNAPTRLTDGKADFVPWEGGHGNGTTPVDRRAREPRGRLPHLGWTRWRPQGDGATACRDSSGHRIAGDVAPRRRQLRNAGGWPRAAAKYDFGLVPRRAWRTRRWSRLAERADRPDLVVTEGPTRSTPT